MVGGVASARANLGERLSPTFVIAGVQKGGTTFLYQELTKHPDVRPALTKELHFFDDNYHRGLRWYSGFFPAARAGRSSITGEASPGYIFHPHALGRIARDLDDARVILLIRDPVDRAFSQYKHERRLGFETLESFGAALDAEERRLAGEWDRQVADEDYVSFPLRHFSYRERGCYADQVRRAFAVLGRDRVLVMRSEDLYSDTREALATTFGFLGLTPWTPRRLGPNDMASAEGGLDVGIERELREFYRPHEEKLDALLGEDPGLSW